MTVKMDQPAHLESNLEKMDTVISGFLTDTKIRTCNSRH